MSSQVEAVYDDDDDDGEHNSRGTMHAGIVDDVDSVAGPRTQLPRGPCRRCRRRRSMTTLVDDDDDWRHDDWVYKEGAWSSSTRASGSAGGATSNILTTQPRERERERSRKIQIPWQIPRYHTTW